MPSSTHTGPLVPFAVACAVFVSLVACGGSSGPAPGSARPKPSERGVPSGPVASGTIAAAGGSLVSPDGRLTVAVSPGTVAEPRTFTIEELTNTAPGGHGTAYRIGPEGTVFSQAVVVAFRPDLGGASLDGYGIATQDGDGYWLRIRNVIRDPVAGTLAVATTHFSDWTVVTRSERDLYGPFTLASTMGLPFTATGTSTLNFAGEDSGGSYYLHWGTIALPASLEAGTATCTPDGSPELAFPTNVADVTRSWTRLGWGVSAHWNLTCNDPFAGTRSEFLAATFDTWGINHLGCARGHLSAPTLGPDLIAGSYRIDCGAQGALTATWSFESCTPGISCTSQDPCQLAAITCGSSGAACADTGPAPDGTSCGTDQVCRAGACVACVSGVACEVASNPCHVGATSCATGTSVCEDTGTAVPNGTSCGADAVCLDGTCSACLADLPCTPAENPCHVGATSCATGTQVCVDTGVPVANGSSCGEDLVCGDGVCNPCDAGAVCGSPNPCTTASIACTSGFPVCAEGAALPNGTACGDGAVCNEGVCSACLENQPCTPSGNACHAGATSCATGTSVCVDTGVNVADGATCGTDAVCGGGTCNSCAAGDACAPANPCKTGTTACGTGFPVCAESGDETDGTVCGVDQVCSGGACVACDEGAACTPANPCHLGAIACATGSPVCQDTGVNAADGTTCGADAVCSAGTCTACTEGAACDPANACRTGAISCTTGTAVCVEGASRPDGTSCGTDLVCSDGACTPCAEGEACSTTGPCTSGTIACGTGAPVCSGESPVADGTSCGTDLVCSGGACVWCQEGVACVSPTDPCQVGTTSCATGTQACGALAAAEDGTPCGEGLVCTGGACGAP